MTGKLGAVLIALLLLTSSCASPPQTTRSRPVQFGEGGTQAAGEAREINGAELQSQLFRFNSTFLESLRDANQLIEDSPDPSLSQQALTRRLVYSSSALSIVLGRNPSENLLDMITFIELSRYIYDKYWIPRVFGSYGVPVSNAFSTASGRIWAIAAQVLSGEQQARLRKVINEWIYDHPNQIAVEGVRLSEFAQVAGVEAERTSQEASGLLASVKKATIVADEALLAADRALYLAQRMPFLIRMNAIVTSHDILTNAMNTLQGGTTAMQVSRGAMADLQGVIRSLKELQAQAALQPDLTKRALGAVSQVSDILKQWNQLVTTPQYAQGISQVTHLADQLQGKSDSFLKKLLGVGVILIALFWVMLVSAWILSRYVSMRLFGEKVVVTTTRDDSSERRAA